MLRNDNSKVVEVATGALVGGVFGMMHAPVSLLGGFGLGFLSECKGSFCDSLVGGGIKAISTAGFCFMAANFYLDMLIYDTIKVNIFDNNAINLITSTGIAGAAMGAGYAMYRLYNQQDQHAGADMPHRVAAARRRVIE